MAWRDLRQFIAYLEQSGQLQRVAVPVQLDQEIGAICRKVMDASGPALLFERPGDYTVPLVVNLLGTRERYALGLGLEEGSLTRQWAERVANPIPPVLISSSEAPCKQNIYLGAQVDLNMFPHPIWNELDGGPYITFPAVISRDPVTGGNNVGMYRVQVHDSRSVGLLMAPYTHVALHRAKAADQPFPVALVLGASPVIHACATAAFPFGVDELAVAGALQLEPIRLVACETIPLAVPADAEIVIEGEILPGDITMEGPFGEFTGYYGPALERPVIQVKAITHRDDPVCWATYEGKPPQESNLLTGIPREAEILRTVPLPGIRAVHLTNGGCGAFTAVVSINKPFEGYGKMMGMAVLGTTPGRYIKTVIVVDNDIDVFNWTEVEWALATRVQPARDVEIMNGITGLILDPSLPSQEKVSGSSRTSKMIIDATRYDAASFELPCMPSQEVMQRVEQNWGKYGIELKDM